MAQTEHHPEEPFQLAERRSGRNLDHEGPEPDLTVLERAANFEASAARLSEVERYSEIGDERPKSVGSDQDLAEARIIFSESARYHAQSISRKELDQSVDQGQIGPELAKSISQAASASVQDQSEDRGFDQDR